MTPYPEPVNLADYETLVRERLDPGAWGYLAGGADDEITLAEKVAAFRRLRLLPRGRRKAPSGPRRLFNTERLAGWRALVPASDRDLHASP